MPKERTRTPNWNKSRRFCRASHCLVRRVALTHTGAFEVFLRLSRCMSTPTLQIQRVVAGVRLPLRNMSRDRSHFLSIRAKLMLFRRSSMPSRFEWLAWFSRSILTSYCRKRTYGILEVLTSEIIQTTLESDNFVERRSVSRRHPSAVEFYSGVWACGHSLGRGCSSSIAEDCAWLIYLTDRWQCRPRGRIRCGSQMSFFSWTYGILLLWMTFMWLRLS
jgi:hypothetical protein